MALDLDNKYVPLYQNNYRFNVDNVFVGLARINHANKHQFLVVQEVLVSNLSCYISKKLTLLLFLWHFYQLLTLRMVSCNTKRNKHMYTRCVLCKHKWRAS